MRFTNSNGLPSHHQRHQNNNFSIFLSQPLVQCAVALWKISFWFSAATVALPAASKSVNL